MLYKIVGYKVYKGNYLLYLTCSQKSKGVIGVLTHSIWVSGKLVSGRALIDNEVYISLQKVDDKYTEKIKFIERIS